MRWMEDYGCPVIYTDLLRRKDFGSYSPYGLSLLREFT